MTKKPTRTMADVSKDIRNLSTGVNLGTYYVYNNEGDIQRQVKATSLEDAQKQMNDLIKKDGSYYVEDRWRWVKDDAGKKLPLEHVARRV